MAQPVKVRILDREYLVTSEEDQEEVQRIAEYVNEKLREVQNNTEGLSDKKTAILAALNIASEYFQLLKEQDDLLSRLRQRTELLIHNIDSVMG
ncbi:MAG: cell division protein ZapA [Deltaproteobacteria bacterium]|nr:MAG: cell division protein ZapA [Deltaproteobacteria bacterium]